LKWSDEQIEKEAEKYDKIDKSVFCWEIGSAFYRKSDKQGVKRAIMWG
jgi:hypothetical protein